MSLWKQIPKDWRELLKDVLSEEDQQKLKELDQFLGQEEEKGKTIFPPKEKRLYALECCRPSQTKVVILGQDPYHGDGQAMGLSFSVPKNQKLPPSLKNIYKEYREDLGLPYPEHGDLSAWAKEGVLLLNTVLSVEKSKAGSHQKKGWEALTQGVLKVLAKSERPIVFILWGSPAQKNARLLEATHHHLIKTVHPSPLSAYRGFFGSKPFSQTNNYLKSQGIPPINWQIP